MVADVDRNADRLRFFRVKKDSCVSYDIFMFSRVMFFLKLFDNTFLLYSTSFPKFSNNPTSISVAFR